MSAPIIDLETSSTTAPSFTVNTNTNQTPAPPSVERDQSQQSSPRAKKQTQQQQLPPKIRRKVIIDTDCGGDDALGILVAAADPDCDLVMLSAVWGNCNVIQGVENLGKLVDVVGRDIPIYLGAAGPLLGHERETAQWYGFGQDGFGDAGFAHSERADEARDSGKHAALAIVEALSRLPEKQGEEVVAKPVPPTSYKNRQPSTNEAGDFVPEGRTAFGAKQKAARRRSLVQLKEHEEQQQQQHPTDATAQHKDFSRTDSGTQNKIVMASATLGASFTDALQEPSSDETETDEKKDEGSVDNTATKNQTLQELHEEKNTENGCDQSESKNKNNNNNDQNQEEQQQQQSPKQEVIEVWQLICLGPLTNIAIALQLQPNLFSRLGSTKYDIPGVIMMGGAMHGKGNASLSAEFNFACDPEAARAVFNNRCSKKPLLVVSWELTVDLALPWEMFDRMLGRMPKRLAQMTAAEISEYSMTDSLKASITKENESKNAFGGNSSSTSMMNSSIGAFIRTGAQNPRLQHFLARLLKKFEETSRPAEVDIGEFERTQDSCVICDAVCVAIALNSKALIEETIKTYATVELHGSESRGSLLIDWYGGEQSRKAKGRWVNTEVVLKAKHQLVNDVISRITVCK